jgi:hypothetical protein
MPAVATIEPAEPVPTYAEPPGAGAFATDLDDEPALPDEARDREVKTATAATPPSDAGPGRVLHVRFSGLGSDRLVPAMETVKTLLRDRPGATKVVLHVPAGTGGTILPMELRSGVAYDTELLAEVRRRLGEGIVELQLA